MMAPISTSKSSVINCQSARRHIAEDHLSHSIHIGASQSIKLTNNWRASTMYILTFRFLGKTCGDTLSILYALYCQLLTFFCGDEFLCFNWLFFFFLCGCPESLIRSMNNTWKSEKSALLCGKSAEWEKSTSAWYSLHINCALNSTSSPLARPRCK